MEDAKVLVKDKFFTASETVELLLPYLREDPNAWVDAPSIWALPK